MNELKYGFASVVINDLLQSTGAPKLFKSYFPYGGKYLIQWYGSLKFDN